MRIKILAVGKNSRGWVADAEADYVKRLKPFVTLAVELVTPEDEHKFGAEIVCVKEGEKILKRLPEHAFVIACDLSGRALSSPELAKKIGELMERGEEIYCLIGGSHGFSDAVSQRAQLKISFSRMTFPHELFRVFLLEQIYRVGMILNNKKYHK